MKKTKKVISLILLAAMLVTTSASHVLAANVCKNIGGSARATTTFTIKTDKTWLTSNQVKLTQTAKGTAEGRTWSGCRPKYYKIWGHYTVYVIDSKGKQKISSWTGKNFTIKGLKKNSTYKVKVVPYSNGSISSTWSGIVNGGFRGWSSTPCWNAKKTKGITFCS